MSGWPRPSSWFSGANERRSDAGARFGAEATAGSIPPPPPGCPPRAAQLAVRQGAVVLVTQWKADFMDGSEGGYTIR